MWSFQSRVFNSVLCRFISKSIHSVSSHHSAQVHAHAYAKVLQFVHPKGCGFFVIVHQWEVFYPDTELISFLQCDHLPQRGRAQARDRCIPGAAAHIAVGLHQNLLVLGLAIPQHDFAGQRGHWLTFEEGHPGVDIVVTRLQDSQPTFLEIVGVPEDWVLHVPLEITSWRDREGSLKMQSLNFQIDFLVLIIIII